MDLRLSDLQNFKVICQAQNLTRASERLGLSQPALTQGVQRLEQHIGVDLLHRDRKGVRPTKAGETLLRDSTTLIEDWVNLKHTVSSQEQECRGTLRLGAHEAVASYTYPHFVSELHHRHPELKLEFKNGLSREIANDIITHQIDLGLVINPIAHPDLVITELARDEVHFWVSTTKTQKESLGTILLNENIAQSQQLLKKLGKKNIFERFIHFDSLANIAQLASTGVGVGIVPERVVQSLKGSVYLKKWNPELKITDRLCLIYHSQNRRLKSIQVTTRLIKDSLR